MLLSVFKAYKVKIQLKMCNSQVTKALLYLQRNNYNFCISFNHPFSIKGLAGKINYSNIQLININLNTFKTVRKFSTLLPSIKNSYNLLHPDYITGFTDAEGCFFN